MRGPFVGFLLVALSLLVAAPAFGHAELLASSPQDGQRLDRAPRVVVLRFSEPVSTVDGGFRIEHASSGVLVRSGPPVAQGAEVRWTVTGPMTRGGYVVRWRVVSDDGHPVAGAFSFGVRAAPAGVSPGDSAAVWSWSVTLARALGYLGFAVLSGMLALLWWCWPEGRHQARAQSVLRVGLVTAVVATVFGLLLQGPENAGVTATRMLDPSLMAEVAHTSFGRWMQLRLYLYLAAAGLLWLSGAVSSAVNRWLAALLVAGVAVTFSGTGHAAASGRVFDRVVDSVHVLCAGFWVGGLLALVSFASARGDRPDTEALGRFSRLALVAVVVLVGTGVVNSVLRLETMSQLWDTAYGRLLMVKLVLVAAALTGAAASRRLVAGGEVPIRSLRYEAAVTVAVLAVTAVLTLMAPPLP